MFLPTATPKGEVQLWTGIFRHLVCVFCRLKGRNKSFNERKYNLNEVELYGHCQFCNSFYLGFLNLNDRYKIR